MKEYIERETAVSELNRIEKLYQNTYMSKVRAEMASYCCQVIKHIPAADVVEVRHGVPNPIYEDTDGAHVYSHIAWYECPFCGSDRIAKYCADCGAKMDGGVNDEV